MSFGVPLLDSLGMMGAIMLVYFCYVFLRALQQQNVIHANWLLIAPISMCMAYGDAYIITAIATHGMKLWWAMGIGGFLGCWASMWVHRRYLNNGKSDCDVLGTEVTPKSIGVHNADVLRQETRG